MNRSLHSSFRVCLVVSLSALAAGCGDRLKATDPIGAEPHVRLVRPEKRTIEREVEQPGFIEAYEQTSLYAKLAGYVRKWNVDIGDPIEENQILAEIAIPELEAEYREKKAQTALDVVMVQVAEELVSVADHNWKVAKAQTQEARAKIDKVLADVDAGNRKSSG